MTRREYLKRKLEKRTEWAEKAESRAEQARERVHQIADNIPLGQPILVGHHSERHARKDQERIENGMHKAVENWALAKHHAQAASGLAHALDRSIFSDDDNAIAALEARIAERTAEKERCKAINKEIRKGDGWAARITPPLTERESSELASNARIWGIVGYPSYVMSNLNGNIAKDKERIATIKARAARTEKAESTGGVLITGGGALTDYINVTFAEKPSRDVINSLKAAGFAWSGGTWCGYRKNLPELS